VHVWVQESDVIEDDVIASSRRGKIRSDWMTPE
jgi:hypothetical protein